LTNTPAALKILETSPPGASTFTHPQAGIHDDTTSCAMTTPSTPRHESHASDNDAEGENDNDTTFPPDLDVPAPTVNSTYSSFETLRHAINSWSLRDGFIARCSKKDTSRAQYRCRYFRDGCQWAVRATVARNTGLLLVTSVNAEHTCNPPEIWMNHEGLAQRGKRAVHATQRWVVDTLNRIGFKPQVTTDPKEIVKIIEDRCGTTVTEKLALKSRDRLLVQMGVQPPLPHGRGGRPDQVAMRRKMREAEAAMAQQRHDDRSSREQESMGLDLSAPSEPPPIDDRPFVFESGFRVIGPRSGPSGPLPAEGFGQHSVQQQSVVDPALSANRIPGTRTCHTCGGTGVLPITNNNHNANDQGPGNSTSQPVPNNSQAARRSEAKDDEIILLRQQVALIARQVDHLSKRRSAGPGTS
jgi:hypothetical protein